MKYTQTAHCILTMSMLLAWQNAISRDSISTSGPTTLNRLSKTTLSTQGGLQGILIPKILGLKDLFVSGTLDFIGFYRNLPSGYPSLSTPKQNLEFTPYPAGGNFNGNFYRQPLLNLVIGAAPSKNTSFAIEYAMSHFYTGQSGDTTRKLSVQNMLQLHGSVATPYGNFLLTAGGGALNYSLSPITIFNKDFREPMFEKLPWDWYSKSFEKYSDQYSTSNTSTPPYIINTATQGFILEGTDLPKKLGFSAFYGRSNFSITPSRADSSYPSQLLAGKIYHGSDSTGKLSINGYDQFGYVDNIGSDKDLKQIVTTEYKYVNQWMRIHAELGTGRVVNPSNKSQWGEAISFNYTLYNKKIGLPIQLQLYSLDKNVAAMEAAYLNANPSVSQGGYGTASQYNNALYPSYLQEVTMLANNRRGGYLKIDKILKNWRIELGNAISQEKKNLSNTVSFQHMVNAFSRSRFQPWIQNTGPYKLINNRYRRSFETIALTDSSRQSKYYNATDLSVKYKSKLFRRNIILNGYAYAGAISKQLRIAPIINNTSYLYTMFGELSAYYQIHPKLTLIGFYSLQSTKANEHTQKSDDTQNTLDQKGTGYGFGLDFDFAPNAGIFLRQRWMQHKDKSFVLDQFKGYETTVELKIFF